MRLCTVGGCTEPHAAHGYCAAHYQRLRRYGDLRTADPIRKQRPKEAPPSSEAQCRRCHVTKPIAEFPVNAKYRNGHSTWCKRCHSVATMEAQHRRVAKQCDEFGRAQEPAPSLLGAPHETRSPITLNGLGGTPCLLGLEAVEEGAAALSARV